MARYASLLGHRVEVHYRCEDTLVPAIGTLVADSGTSICLEERFLHQRQMKPHRWEIPYGSIVRLSKSAMPQPAPKAAISASHPPADIVRKA